MSVQLPVASCRRLELRTEGFQLRSRESGDEVVEQLYHFEDKGGGEVALSTGDDADPRPDDGRAGHHAPEAHQTGPAGKPQRSSPFAQLRTISKWGDWFSWIMTNL